MLFYVPPMLPVQARIKDKRYEIKGADSEGLAALLSSLDQARMPLRYFTSLFSAGNEEVVSAVYRKLIAVRIYKRAQKVKDVSEAEAHMALVQGRTTVQEAEAIFRLTSLPTFEERFVIPPMAREMAIEMTQDPFINKPHTGFGSSSQKPERRY